MWDNHSHLSANVLLTSNFVQYNLYSHRGNLERVVGATVVKVMAHTRDKKSKNLYVSKKKIKMGQFAMLICLCTAIILASKKSTLLAEK